MYAPKFHDPDTNTTAKTSAAVTGGRVLAVTGENTVAHAPAGSTSAVGTAYYDAASGALVAVAHGGVQRWTAGANVADGNQLVAAADGKVRAFDDETDSASAVIGVALETFAANATGACQALI